MEYIENLLRSYGVREDMLGYVTTGILAFGILVLCIIANLVTKKIVLRILTHFINNNNYRWDDIMLERKVFQRIGHIIPAIIVFLSASMFYNLQELIRRLAASYILIVAIFVISAVLDSINDIYKTYPISKIRPIKGLLQVVKIVVYIVVSIVIIATMLGEKPFILLSGVGALAAVFSFVFKDSILGFIAGIQLTSNDMLQIGDWIEMPKYGADGNVIDITLNTVKVQNFDKTIVTIPAYALISDSFKNWRGMLEFGGRRIKRSIYIDLDSIGFCTDEMITKFKRIHYLKDYMIEMEQEVEQYNMLNQIDTELLVNGRRLTNIGTFRAYILNYLKNHPMLHDEMAKMVRQLPPSENGLPLEIVAFTNGTDWIYYENIQADIFDHILSVAGEFGLRIFQNPTGYDVKQISH